MVIDLIMLVLIATLFFIFLSSQVANEARDTGVIRSQSSYIQRLMISVIDYPVQNGTYQNATVAELIGAYHCNIPNKPSSSIINSTVYDAVSKLGKDNYYFIFTYSPTIATAVYNNYSCVKTETINIAKFNMDLPCNKTVDLTLGIWPASQKVEPC